ncbi:hypothetical protein DXG03_009053 [Asterophora parasitica]|uniref:Uncharacterized protein n=1 Tax=Asterophora parasitica TaxID=117018 RepID=A0A9P7KB56_9AGAR|nr:hypothetical protein DXG03_009053 [Asterophora parasitica]
MPYVFPLMKKSHKAIEHDVSFDFTTSRHSRQSTRRALIRPSTPIPLPLEIVLSIIEAAAYDSATPDEALLKQCALVCRAWSLPAQKLLFSSVTLRSETACSSFRGAINPSTERGRVLGSAVVRLCIIMDHNHPFGLSQHSFANAVTSCPKLFELKLALYGSAAPGEDLIGVPDVSRMRRPAPSFDDHTLSLLRSGPMISALQFSNWSENQHSITQLLDVWPALKYLAISGTPPQPPSPFLEPFRCSLEELRMNFQSPPSFDFMNWLLHNSSDTLRILAFEREPSTQLLEHLTNVHGATLSSLSLPSCHLPDHASAVQKCHQLRELRFENPMVSPKLWKAIPTTLQHVALGVNINTSMQPVIDLIKTSDSLKAVSICTSSNGAQHTLFPVVKMACAYQGIGLSVMHDIDTFRSQMRYGQQGIRAFLPISGMSDSNAPRTNKRFLTSIIKSTDDHNKTILRAQAQAAQEVKHEREEQERRERRARAQEAADAERRRRTGKSSRRRHSREDEGWDRWDGRTADRKRKARAWETWDGEDEEDEEDRNRPKRPHRSGERRGGRDEDSGRRSKRERGSSRSQRDRSRDRRRSEKKPSRRRRSKDDSRERSPRSRSPPDEGDARSSRRDTNRHRSHRMQRLSASASPLRDHSPSVSQTDGSSSNRHKLKRSTKYALDDLGSDTAPRSRHHSPRRSPSPARSEVESREEELRRKLSSRNIEQAAAGSSKRRRTPPRDLSRSPSPKPKRHKTDSTSSRTARTRSISPDDASRHSTPGPSSPPIQLPSKMDKYFEESYDPRLDVAPLAVPKVPATGLINNAEFEGWDAMLELLRVRREDKEEKKRMERLGITKDKGKDKKGASDSVGDRWNAEGVSIMEIEYKKRGAVREWDLGKEGF